MSGYREDSFDLDTPGPDEPLTSQENHRAKRIVIGFGMVLFLLLDALLWLTERGGLISVITAVSSVHARLAVIDVDSAGLRLPMILITLLVVLGASRLLGLQLGTSTRKRALIPIMLTIGGGFVLDGAFGESIMTQYMARHGYGRCEAGDWAQGNGKSRVWFADYVLQGVECRQGMQTVPERSLFS